MLPRELSAYVWYVCWHHTTESLGLVCFAVRTICCFILAAHRVTKHDIPFGVHWRCVCYKTRQLPGCVTEWWKIQCRSSHSNGFYITLFMNRFRIQQILLYIHRIWCNIVAAIGWQSKIGVTIFPHILLQSLSIQCWSALAGWLAAMRNCTLALNRLDGVSTKLYRKSRKNITTHGMAHRLLTTLTTTTTTTSMIFRGPNCRIVSVAPKYRAQIRVAAIFIWNVIGTHSSAIAKFDDSQQPASQPNGTSLHGIHIL